MTVTTVQGATAEEWTQWAVTHCPSAALQLEHNPQSASGNAGYNQFNPTHSQELGYNHFRAINLPEHHLPKHALHLRHHRHEPHRWEE
jgi:hypothetical protein